VKYRSVPAEELVIRECLDEIINAIGGNKQVILIGSSLGGCLVSKLVLEIPDTIKHVFLLNPAIIPPDVDISSIPDMPQRILKDMKDDRLFSQKLDCQVTVFSANGDEVVPPEWVLRFARFQEATVKFLHDDHRFTKHLNRLPQMIKSFM
jgi:pimeloyl-ACP methyl ester carboxylesterase